MSNNTNIDALFPSTYLKAADLQGLEPIVTIDRVEVEAVGTKKEQKGILYFRGKTKGLVLNKTNATAIATITGSRDTTEWTGHQIRLFAARVDFQGQQVDGVRIKAAGVAPAPVSGVADDLGF